MLHIMLFYPIRYMLYTYLYKLTFIIVSQTHKKTSFYFFQ